MILQDLFQVAGSKGRKEVDDVGAIHLLPGRVCGDKGGHLLAIHKLLVESAMENGG